MANPSAAQWLRQAQSDFHCADRGVLREDTATFCHAIAKYQQAVEKALKGLVVALNLIEPTRDHEATEELKELTAFIFNPQGRRNRNFVSRISHLMSNQNRTAIRSLLLLAPKYPEVNELARRNTEYPFQDAAGEWKIPSDEDAFSLQELDQFRLIANTIVKGASEIIVERDLAPRR